MTTHPIDTEAMARRAGHVLFTHVPEQPAATARETCVLLDLLAAAEHRIARLEAQTDIRGRAVVMYRERAREAEADRDLWREASAKLAASSNQVNADLYEAEARIKAVRAIHRDLYESMSGVPYCDECDRAWPCPTIRALDG